MKHCTESVICKFSSDIVLAYGQSDVFSFVFRRNTNLFERRPRYSCENALVMGIILSIICSKIMSTVVAHFTACYIFYWSSFFPATQLLYPPSFDGELMTFLALDAVQHKRQVDCPVITIHAACGPWNIVFDKRTLIGWIDPLDCSLTVEQQLTAS